MKYPIFLESNQETDDAERMKVHCLIPYEHNAFIGIGIDAF